MQTKFPYWAAVLAITAGLAQADPGPKLTPVTPPIGSHTGLYWNASEPGWGVNVSHQGNIAFGTLFVYGDQGEPRWYVMSNGALNGQGGFEGALYETRMVGNAVNVETVGSMRLTFGIDGAGTLQYEVRGRSVAKSIAPQRFAGTPPICHMVGGTRAAATSYQDLWYDATEPGWGLNLAHQGEILFGTLFTYGSDGQPSWLVMSNGTRQSDGSWLGALYRTKGTPFHATTFTPLRPEDVTTVGSIRLRFQNGERAQLDLVVDGSTRTRTITRQAFATSGPDCSNPAIISALGDPTIYAWQGNAQLTSATEASAVARGTIEVPGFGRGAFQANTGHLTAMSSAGTPRASMFYVSYALLGVDPASRPVVFFWNGGPGSSTSWLHLGSFAPLRLETYAPDSEGKVQPVLQPNAETLLPTADLVFVDALGTGYSQAIAPAKNSDFWGVESDAILFADFIRRYLAVNGRTTSPVYLLGESYGGIRTPIVARILEQAGVRVTGVILQSPAMNYNSNCGLAPLSCAGYLPSYAAVAQYHGKSVPPPLAGSTAEQMTPTDFRNRLMPPTVIGRYDGRMKAAAGTPAAQSGDPSSYYAGVGIQNAVPPLLVALGYSASTSYVQGISLSNWVFNYGGNVRPDAVPDMAAAMQLNPSMRLLAVSGLHDLATPWYQTEIDASRLALPSRVTLRNYDGGHMTYFTEASRRKEHADITAFLRGEAVPAESAKSVVEAPGWATVKRAWDVPLATLAEFDSQPLGPWVPEHVRFDPRVAPQTRGVELQQQVDKILGVNSPRTRTPVPP